MQRYTAIFQVAYHAIIDGHRSDTTIILSSREVGAILQQAIDASLGGTHQTFCTTPHQKSKMTTRIQSRTQTSVANQRQPALQVEKGVSSTGDVVAFTLLLDDEQRHMMEQDDDVWRGRIQQEINEILTTEYNLHQQGQICLLSAKILSSRDNHFHAEKDCTQRIFHYLLPLSWLPDGQALEQWWMDNESLEASERRPPPSDSLKRLRTALKRATSTSVPNRKVRRRKQHQYQNDENEPSKDHPVSTQQSASSSGRRSRIFGNQVPLCWHNFADTHLYGQASPNQDTVWRIVDAACIAGFTRIHNDDSTAVAAVLEFRGDDFVQGQVRSMVATIVAMTHDWLPPDTFEMATRPDSFLHIPVAPVGRLYATTPRFHFHEGSESGLNGVTTRSDEWIQQRLLMERQSEKENEAGWIGHLNSTSAPLLESQLANMRMDSESLPNDPAGAYRITKSPTPKVYSLTLQLLRQIIANDEWPKTSLARASVIRSGSANTETRKRIGGSFTVFNPAFLDTIVEKGNSPPLGNIQFPELTRAIFDLESQLASEGILPKSAVNGTLLTTESINNTAPRPPSLCCAINCNAQFTPHVDSGRGQGQSVSMIVGLGDYSGGELFVEGVPYAIRYQPLEFDGWSSRHWTGHYNGERFSLVWFSPDMK